MRAIAEYFRLKPAVVKPALAHLVGSRMAERVEVAGLAGEWYLAASARVPRRVTGAALVSPFDSLVFERRRLEDLFEFRYRIEIYVPAAQRHYGYYVYPFLLDGAFAARVDLKADRARGVLRVQAAWLEDGWAADAVTSRLAAELSSMAGWLGLGGVTVMGVGTLAPALARALG